MDIISVTNVIVRTWIKKSINYELPSQFQKMYETLLNNQWFMQQDTKTQKTCVHPVFTGLHWFIYKV